MHQVKIWEPIRAAHSLGFILIVVIFGLAACQTAPPPPQDSDIEVDTPPPPPPPPPPPAESVDPVDVEPVQVVRAPPARRTFGAPAASVPDTPAGHPCDPVEGATNGYVCETVLYGTNRQPLAKTEPSEKARRKARNKPIIGQDAGALYGIQADCEPDPGKYRDATRLTKVCHLGEVTVAIPATRRESGGIDAAKPGQFIQDTKKKLFWIAGHFAYCSDEMTQHFATLDDPHLYAAYLDTCDDPETGRAHFFANRVAELTGGNSDGHAFVYIHGFNVAFRNAAFRAAQLKYDMNFEGPVMFYSWPSNASVTDYFSDQIDGDLSVDGLVRFLNLAHRATSCLEIDLSGPCTPSGTKLHVIAHSMGARITSQALARLAVSDSQIEFGEAIFAAGDVDHALFQKWIGAALPIVDGVTVYSSRHDGAVTFSRWIREFSMPWGRKTKEKRPRIGIIRETEGPFIYDPNHLDDGQRVHTVDISNLAATTSFFLPRWRKWFVDNHARFAETFTITDDILDVMCNGADRDPAQRGVARVQNDQNAKRRYWTVGKTNPPKRASKQPPVQTRFGCLTDFSALKPQ